jgi:hypothetical protein
MGVDLAARNEPINLDRARVLDDKPARLGCGRRHGRGGASAWAVRLSEGCLADRGRCRRLDRRRTGSPPLSLPTCDLKLFVLNRQEAAVADLVAAPFVRAVNGPASDRIDELLARPLPVLLLI